MRLELEYDEDDIDKEKYLDGQRAVPRLAGGIAATHHAGPSTNLERLLIRMLVVAERRMESRLGKSAPCIVEITSMFGHLPAAPG